MIDKSPDIAPQPYRGRFAPSPTGPLHFGSLVTALGSFLQARRQHGVWLVRIDDLDPPREMAGAADDILRTLEAFHLYWDETVLYQSQRSEAYQAAIEQLARERLTFPCACTRKTILKATRDASESIYPGTCRGGLPSGAEPRSIRLHVPPQNIQFIDTLRGPLQTPLHHKVGDFVVRRADGLYAYHLAVVVDDAYQDISEVMRGADLLEATPPQIYLQSLLGHNQPQYAHLPIAVNAQGEKLSKQTYAEPVATRNPGPVLRKALAFLGHQPDSEVDENNPEELLAWAIAHWDLARIPTQLTIQHVSNS